MKSGLDFVALLQTTAGTGGFLMYFGLPVVSPTCLPDLTFDPSQQKGVFYSPHNYCSTVDALLSCLLVQSQLDSRSISYFDAPFQFRGVAFIVFCRLGCVGVKTYDDFSLF